MYFTKDEIIELTDKKKYLVLDTAILDEKSYFKVKEVDENYENLIGDYKIITAVNDNGALYISEDIKPDELDKLKELFN